MRKENKYIEVKPHVIKVIASEHFVESISKKKVSLGPVKHVFKTLAQKPYPKEGESSVNYLFDDGYDTVLASRISREEIMLINAYRSNAKPKNNAEHIKVKSSNLIIVPSRHFVKRSDVRNVDFDLISDIDKQMSASRIGQPFVVSNGNSTVICVKKNYTTVILITCFENGAMDWDDYLDVKL